MHHRTLSVLLALPFALFLVLGPGVGSSWAIDENKDASISLYLVPQSGPLQCAAIDPPDCENDELLGEGSLYTSYYAILAVFNANGEAGIKGLSCGLEYNNTPSQGVDVWSWTRCTDGLEFDNHNWPASGGGNRITWNTCQNEEPGGAGSGVTAIVGFFYLSAYSDDTFRVVQNTFDAGAPPELVVASCEGAESYLNYPNQAGWVGFSDDGSVKGNVQCGKPKEDATWGEVKTRWGK
jgi:hypothetical protein